MFIMNSSIVAHLAQPSSLDVLVLVGEVGVQAGLHSTTAPSCTRTCGVLGLRSFGQLVSTHVENGLIEIFLSV